MARVSCLLSGGYSPFSSTSPLAIVLRSRPHRRAGGGGGLLAIPVRAAFDRLAPPPAGSPSTASSLQSEHPFHQLDENLAGFEHTGRGVGGGRASVVPCWGAASSRRDSSLLQSLLSGIGIRLCTLIRSILNCLQFPSWGKGGGRLGRWQWCAVNQGTQEQLANLKPVGRVVLNS